jgi:hypothetical protein
MKYLKKFILNESVNTDEVQEFCDNHLDKLDINYPILSIEFLIDN